MLTFWHMSSYFFLSSYYNFIGEFTQQHSTAKLLKRREGKKVKPFSTWNLVWNCSFCSVLPSPIFPNKGCTCQLLDGLVVWRYSRMSVSDDQDKVRGTVFWLALCWEVPGQICGVQLLEDVVVVDPSGQQLFFCPRSCRLASCSPRIRHTGVSAALKTTSILRLKKLFRWIWLLYPALFGLLIKSLREA